MAKLRMAFHIGAGVGEVQVRRRGWGSFAQGAEANFGGCGKEVGRILAEAKVGELIDIVL
jgi:hypothetical protein